MLTINDSIRRLLEDRQPMKQTMTRRYYASCSAVEYQPLLGTMNEAVAAAKAKLLDEGSKANKFGEIYIVEVVKIVRLEPQQVKTEEDKPIEVIEVRR